MMQKDLSMLEREDFCFKEFPVSFAFNIYWMRGILGFLTLYFCVLLSVMLFFGYFFLSFDGYVQGYMGLHEGAQLTKSLRHRLVLPMALTNAQVDFGIRNNVYMEASDWPGLRRLIQYFPEKYPVIDDVRVMFNGESYSFYSSRDRFQSDIPKCWEMGNFGCLPVGAKPFEGSLDWYRNALSLFPPSRMKKITFCAFRSPEMTQYNYPIDFRSPDYYGRSPNDELM